MFLGTLNLELDKDIILENTDKITPEEYDGDFEVLVEKCEIQGHRAYIVRPEKNNKEGGDHSLNIVEIVSDVNIREITEAKDGDFLIIEI